MAIKAGLVLAGGGAKGAYQSGAVKYLAEIDFVPQIVAGTSIGALNGAIIASHPPFNHAAERLWELWTELGEADIIQTQFSRYIAELRLYIDLSGESTSIVNTAPIEKFLRHAVNPDRLRQGIELWVAAFPSVQTFFKKNDLKALALDILRSKTGLTSDYFHVQAAKTDEEIYQTLLASAAVPMGFKPRQLDGKHYVDGWLGDNVPLKALAQRGCTHAIVIHLENGSLWNRHEFPNQAVFEIRPTETINKSNTPLVGDLTTFLDFSPAHIRSLQERGYNDAKRCLEPLLKTLEIEQSRRESLDRLETMTKRLMDDPPLERSNHRNLDRLQEIKKRLTDAPP
jgi:NTE family protein